MTKVIEQKSESKKAISVDIASTAITNNTITISKSEYDTLKSEIQNLK